MTTLQIRRMNARYHLPPALRQERARLDRVLQTVLDEPLEQALERAGVSQHEHVCIRRLDVSVRLRLSSPDSAIGLTWSRALGESIARARNGQGPVDVVRYSSITHLLLDIVIGFATDRFERAWAWRMSGLWNALDTPSRHEAAEDLVSALIERPHTIVPVLAAAASPCTPRRVFAALLRRLSDEQWISLARAALLAAGGPVHVIEDAVVPGIAEVAAEARAMQNRSVLARAIEATSRGVAPSQAIERRRALAVLVLLECDPGTARDVARTRHLVNTLADAFHPAARPADDAKTQAKSGDVAPPVVGDDELLPAVTRRVHTAYGGLLFLLNLLGPLGLVAAVQERRGRRSFRWVLHQMAVALCATGPDDPAVMAFAGLSSDAVPPNRDEEPPTENEQQTVRDLMAALTTALDEQIEERPALSFVCSRDAVVVSDPGWIDVRFAFRDAATSIRRAGLDLSPGYLPWLGTVVVFSYE